MAILQKKMLGCCRCLGLWYLNNSWKIHLTLHQYIDLWEEIQLSCQFFLTCLCETHEALNHGMTIRIYIVQWKLCLSVLFRFFWKKWTHVLLWGLCYPCFKTRVISHLCALSSACKRTLSFTSGLTPGDLLVAIITAESFWFMYLYTNICLTVWILGFVYIFTGVLAQGSILEVPMQLVNFEVLHDIDVKAMRDS